MKDDDMVWITSTNGVHKIKKTQRENSKGRENMEDLAQYNYNRPPEDGRRASDRNMHVKQIKM
jgi:hypothetical protein